MIEGPVENALASLEAILRCPVPRTMQRYRAELESERRLRIIRNLPRNRHAWKGKRFPVDESKLPAPPQRSGLEPLPPGYYPKGDR
jgi:hypothetical protein